jgi:hypothetical protein
VKYRGEEKQVLFRWSSLKFSKIAAVTALSPFYSAMVNFRVTDGVGAKQLVAEIFTFSPVLTWLTLQIVLFFIFIQDKSSFCVWSST